MARKSFKDMTQFQVGQHFCECDLGQVLEFAITTEPVVKDVDGRRQITWTGRDVKTQRDIEYLVTEGFEHYGPKIYDPADMFSPEDVALALRQLRQSPNVLQKVEVDPGAPGGDETVVSCIVPINGKDHHLVLPVTLHYRGICRLAGYNDDRLYTITYVSQQGSGIVGPNDSLQITAGTKINVALTNNA